MVERLLAKEEVASSTLVFRSNPHTKSPPLAGFLRSWARAAQAAAVRSRCTPRRGFDGELWVRAKDLIQISAGSIVDISRQETAPTCPAESGWSTERFQLPNQSSPRLIEGRGEAVERGAAASSTTRANL